MADAFTIGVEEEYFVTNPKTRNTLRRMPPKMMARSVEILGDRVTHEMLQSQIEVATGVCSTVAQAREELTRLRRGVVEAAAEHGLAIVAAGTHPLAAWSEQRQTDKPRYDLLMDDLRMIGRRNLVCGLHVHLELPDPERRVEVMGRMAPFLPYLLALSTSSPFWNKQRTGLMGYRLAHYDELPRTGLPPLLRDGREYTTYIETLTQAGIIPDASYIWWMIRPSKRFPTLELRVADSCTYLDDAIAIAALYRCLGRALWRQPDLHAQWTGITALIVDENKWRAQRYGIDEGFVDERERRLIPFRDAFATLLGLVAEDIAHFGCEAEIELARRILTRGTSAHRQLSLYNEARQRGLGRMAALRGVVDWLIATTRAV
jgi:glutamate---cysteine ligase / carboxylate-amine ligase